MKRIDITISYNFQFSPKDFGMEDESEEEFIAAVKGYLIRVQNELKPFVGAPDEINVEETEI